MKTPLLKILLFICLISTSSSMLCNSNDTQLSVALDSSSDIKQMKVWLCDDNSEYMKGYFKILATQKPPITQRLSCKSFGLYPIHPRHQTTDAYVTPAKIGFNIHNHFASKICTITFNDIAVTVAPTKTITINQKYIQKTNAVTVSCNSIRN